MTVEFDTMALRSRSTVSRLALGVACLAFAVASNAFSIPRSPRSAAASVSSFLSGPEAPPPAFRGSNSDGKNQNLLAASAVLPIGGIARKGWEVFATLLKIASRELRALSPIQAGLFVAVFALGLQLGRSTPLWRRMTSVLDIPSKYFGPTAPLIKGRAVSVSDGDTIRLLHVPTPFSRSTVVKQGKNKEKVSEVALPIRLCTIDTPETAKFGKSGQPFGPEAKEKMKELVENKIVAVRLLMKDQYGRAVASVYTGRWPFRKAVDELMLKEGLAEVYQGSGAVYGQKGLEEYLAMEAEAQKEKIGIWSQKKRESAAEYKKRTK